MKKSPLLKGSSPSILPTDIIPDLFLVKCLSAVFCSLFFSQIYKRILSRFPQSQIIKIWLKTIDELYKKWGNHLKGLFFVSLAHGNNFHEIWGLKFLAFEPKSRLSQWSIGSNFLDLKLKSFLKFSLRYDIFKAPWHFSSNTIKYPINMTYFQITKYLTDEHDNWYYKNDFAFFSWLIEFFFFAFSNVVEQ